MHQGHHQLSYAIFSIVVAILGSWTALDLQRQVRAHVGRTRQYWLLGAALASGISIWGMHFLAMLGFDAGMPISYDIPLTAFSLAVAVGGTAFAFVSVMHDDPAGQPPKGKLAIAGVAMGSSIALMHFIGMAAMRVPATVVYSLPIVAASFAIAIAASWAALTTATRSPGPSLRAAGAVVLGLAIASMHYTAMAAVSFDPNPGATSNGGIDQSALAVLVGSATTTLLVLGLMSAVFDRRINAIALREASVSAANERHLRQILSRMPLGIIAISSRTRDILFTNPQADAILQGRNPLSLPFLGEDGTPLPMDGNPFTRALGGDTWPDRAMSRIAVGDGRTGFLEITATALHDDAGGDGEIVFMISDATARIDAETTIAQAQKLETIGQLTGGVAHDFNNLLTPIIGGLDMLRRDQSLSPKAGRIIESAMQASQRAATLVQRLLAFARRQTLQVRNVDVKSLLVGLEDLIGRSIGPIVDTSIEAPEGLGVRADPGQLELAILNLAVNARDAMPDGGRLSISATRMTLKPSDGFKLPVGDYVCISVVDNGVGMDDATRQRAVEPFFSTKGLGKGTGLGLSMVHGLAAQSQGEMRITSSPGVGTRVDLVLPWVEIPCEEVVTESSQAASSSMTTTVLLVDDEEIVRRATADVLIDMGHVVIEAASGIQALGLIRSNPDIGLVVSDHLMPGMTGAALAGELEIAAPDVPVLIISGYANPDELPKHLPFISKPFRRNDLIRQIDRLLAHGPNVHRISRAKCSN